MPLLTDLDHIHSMQEIYQTIHEIHKVTVRIWMDTSLFTWQWWLGVGLTIIPWGVWFILHKKDSKDRLLYAGLSIMLMSSWLDFTGVAFGLWSYNYTVLPSVPAYVPWDFSLMPTIVMLLLQYKPEVNPLIKAIVFGGLSSFVGGSFFRWIDLYTIEEWKHIYSFIIYIILYLVTHFISKGNKFNVLTDKKG